MKVLRNIIGWLVIAVCVLWTAAFAEPVTFAWDAPASERGVTLTHLRKQLPDGSSIFLIESNGTTATVELPPGTHTIVATDFSPAGWSPFSDPVTVTVEPPAWTLSGNILTITRPCAIKITPQFSADLTRWRKYDSPTTPFTRIKISDL